MQDLPDDLGDRLALQGRSSLELGSQLLIGSNRQWFGHAKSVLRRTTPSNSSFESEPDSQPEGEAREEPLLLQPFYSRFPHVSGPIRYPCKPQWLLQRRTLIREASNEEFASTLRRVPFPFRGEVEAETETTGLEIYHGAHGQYETHAPIFSFIPYELEGETHLLAGYLCTPLVTFPLEEVRKKDKLRGKTIAELGFGNVPTDLVAYEYEDEGYLLILNSTRGPMLIEASDVREAHKRPGITTEVGPRTGVDYLTPGLRTAVQVADLDSDHLMVLDRSANNGALTLYARNKRWM